MVAATFVHIPCVSQRSYGFMGVLGFALGELEGLCEVPGFVSSRKTLLTISPAWSMEKMLPSLLTCDAKMRFIAVRLSVCCRGGRSAGKSPLLADAGMLRGKKLVSFYDCVSSCQAEWVSVCRSWKWVRLRWVAASALCREYMGIVCARKPCS